MKQIKTKTTGNRDPGEEKIEEEKIQRKAAIASLNCTGSSEQSLLKLTRHLLLHLRAAVIKCWFVCWP